MEREHRNPLESEGAPPSSVVPSTPRAQTYSRPIVGYQDELDATLGNLVDHFASLPPPVYGEAPLTLDNSPLFQPRQNASSRTSTITASSKQGISWKWFAYGLGAMIFGALGTFVLMTGPVRALSLIGWNISEHSETIVSKKTVSEVVPVKITPRSEPLADVKTPADPSEKAVVKKLSSGNRPKKIATKQDKTQSKDSSQPVAGEQKDSQEKKIQKQDKEDGWEDPYK